MNIQAIKGMIAQLKGAIGIPVIKGNTTSPRPTLPFAVYTITAPYIKERSRPSIIQVEVDSKTYEKMREEYKFIISFNLYANDYETTMEQAFNLRQWFLFLGENFLDDNDLVPVNVGNIQDRTTFLIDAYEYKCGFDIQFRTSYEQLRELEAIEKVEL